MIIGDNEYKDKKPYRYKRPSQKVRNIVMRIPLQLIKYQSLETIRKGVDVENHAFTQCWVENSWFVLDPYWATNEYHMYHPICYDGDTYLDGGKVYDRYIFKFNSLLDKFNEVRKREVSPHEYNEYPIMIVGDNDTARLALFSKKDYDTICKYYNPVYHKGIQKSYNVIWMDFGVRVPYYIEYESDGVHAHLAINPNHPHIRTCSICSRYFFLANGFQYNFYDSYDRLERVVNLCSVRCKKKYLNSNPDLSNLRL